MRIFLMLLFCAFLISCSEKKNKVPNNPVPTLDSSASNNSEASKEQETQESSMSKEQLAQADKIIKNTSAEAIASMNGKKLFKTNCAICHGFKGDMMINGAKDLTKSEISLTEAVAQVYFGKGLMTPFKGVMKDEEIVAVTKYVETLRK